MFTNCILFATFCYMGTLVRRRKPWRYSARKVMEFRILMTDIPVYVSCKFEMYIFKIALVISENVCIAFLYVLSIYSKNGFTGLYFIFVIFPQKHRLWVLVRTPSFWWFQQVPTICFEQKIKVMISYLKSVIFNSGKNHSILHMHILKSKYRTPEKIRINTLIFK